MLCLQSAATRYLGDSHCYTNSHLRPIHREQETIPNLRSNRSEWEPKEKNDRTSNCKQGVIGRKSETNEIFLSALSSHLHAPQQVPKHADRIEWIDGTRTHSTAVVVLKVERSRHTQLVLFVVVVVLFLGASLSLCMGIAALFVIVPRLVRLGRRRLRLLSTRIPHRFGLSRRSSNLGLLDRIRKRH